MSIQVKEIDESNPEDEACLCVPPKDSEPYSFEKGIRDKVEWLRWKMQDYGHIGHIAYSGSGKPLGFIEFVPSTDCPLPIETSEKTSLITCINLLQESRGQNVGTMLLKATLRQLWKIGVSQVKTLVSRSPQWINSGLYLKHGFQLEKTFLRLGSTEPLDLLTYSLDLPQPKIKPAVVNITPESRNKLPVEVLYFHSAQCPYSCIIYRSHVDAVSKFSSNKVILKVIDSWKDHETAQKHICMYSDTLINGRSPFFAPPTQEGIETEIRKELERIHA